MNEPWVTSDLRHCIRKKYHLYNLLKRGLILRRDFVNYKNTLTYVIGLMRKRYYTRKIQDSETNSKRVWRHINKLMNRKTNSGVKSIIDGNNLTHKGIQMVNEFNNYFSSVVSDLLEGLPNVIDYGFLNSIERVYSTFYFFQPILLKFLI